MKAPNVTTFIKETKEEIEVEIILSLSEEIRISVSEEDNKIILRYEELDQYEGWVSNNTSNIEKDLFRDFLEAINKHL